MPLVKILVKAMGDKRYPRILPIVCTGLCQIARSRDADFDDDEDRRVLSEVSVKLLPALFRLVETLHGTGASSSNAKADTNDDDDEEMEDAEGGGGKKKKTTAQDVDTQRVVSVTDAIAAYAPLAPITYLRGLFQKNNGTPPPRR